MALSAFVCHNGEIQNIEERFMLDRLNDDIKTAMKAREKEKLEALRYLKSMLMENKTSTKPRDEMDVVISHVKKLKDSVETFPVDNPIRQKTINEIEFLAVYMPEPLTEEKVKAIIQEIIAKHGKPHMGVVMKELTPQIKGRFDGKLANQFVKEVLG